MVISGAGQERNQSRTESIRSTAYRNSAREAGWAYGLPTSKRSKNTNGGSKGSITSESNTSTPSATNSSKSNAAKRNARQRNTARKVTGECSKVQPAIVRAVSTHGFPICGKSNMLNNGAGCSAVQVVSSEQANTGELTLMADNQTRAVEPVRRLRLPSLDLSSQSDTNHHRFTHPAAAAAALRHAALFAAVSLHSNDPRRVVAKGRLGVVRACKPDDSGDT